MNEHAQQQRKEECRRYLAERQALAFPVPAIRRKLRSDGNDFSDEEIAAASEFLVSLSPPQVKIERDPLGATKCYQATGHGVLEHERSL
jgi:hypothetical protein